MQHIAAKHVRRQRVTSRAVDKLLHYNTRQITNDDGNQFVRKLTTIESSSLTASPEAINYVKNSECKVFLKVN